MKRRVLAAVAVVVGVIMAGMPAVLSQAPPPENQVKATFLYNFAQFIEWPSKAFATPESAFTMCVTGDPIERALKNTVEKQKIDGRPFIVRRLAPSDNLRGCHLVYVGRMEARRSMEIIAEASRIFAADGLPILTVADSADFINIGGMIRFTESRGRVRFQINPDAAERVSLRVSSRLLRVADVVRPHE
jgi:hypothetical protein